MIQPGGAELRNLASRVVRAHRARNLPPPSVLPLSHSPRSSRQRAERSYRRTCTSPCSSRKYLSSSAHSGFEVRDAAPTHSSRGGIAPRAPSCALARQAEAARRSSAFNPMSHRIAITSLPAAISEISRCATLWPRHRQAGAAAESPSPRTDERVSHMAATPRKPPIPSACEHDNGRAQYPPHERDVEQYTEKYRHTELAHGRE